ncbi:hypothetical protein [Qipengyuania flava]|uniref:hypothetical protein n=1 Tax=Qipengyuania flava TaxID=192812 RepID=UPI00141BEB16|nr:hypothetical protein [Qipengyuania flava]NIJ62708.1 hypothetical protein [Qipengyuania flava]
MYLAIKTKMSGVPLPNFSLDHPSQPKLLHFAGVVFDEAGQELESLIAEVRQGEPASIRAGRNGLERIAPNLPESDSAEPKDVSNWFRTRAKRAKWLVGHEIYLGVINMAIAGAKAESAAFMPNCRLFCTSLQSIQVVNSPPTAQMMEAGRYHPKMPTLRECAAVILDESSDLEPDCRTELDWTVRIFRRVMHERGERFY